MKENKPKLTDLDQRIINVVEKVKPQTVEQLIKLLQSEQVIPRRDILDAIIKLQNQGRITLKQPKAQFDFTLTEYILSSKAHWYWTIIVLSAITTILVFIIPENAYPIVYARHILGTVFVLWLPGYSLMKALFPTKEIDNIERIALSIGMSLTLVPIVGLVLNYTPWGIRVTPITLSLLALTITFATVALMRESICLLDLRK